MLSLFLWACLILRLFRCLLMCESLSVTPVETMLYKEARVQLKRSVFSSNRALWSAESHPPERAKRGSLFFCGEGKKQSLSSSSHWRMRKETDAPAVFLRHRRRSVSVATSPPHPCFSSPRRPESKGWEIFWHLRWFPAGRKAISACFLLLTLLSSQLLLKIKVSISSRLDFKGLKVVCVSLEVLQRLL